MLFPKAFCGLPQREFTDPPLTYLNIWYEIKALFQLVWPLSPWLSPPPIPSRPLHPSHACPQPKTWAQLAPAHWRQLAANSVYIVAGGLRQRVQCLQPAFTLNYIKWSLLAGPGWTVGAVIVSSLAAGDLLQALPTSLLLPALSTYIITVFLRGKRGRAAHRSRGGWAGERPQSLWKFESVELWGFDLSGAQLCLFPVTVTAPGNALTASSPLASHRRAQCLCEEWNTNNMGLAQNQTWPGNELVDSHPCSWPMANAGKWAG